MLYSIPRYSKVSHCAIPPRGLTSHVSSHSLPFSPRLPEIHRMGILSLTSRLFLLAAWALIVTHAPLFSCYGRKTGKDKVRIAPASYFVFGVEQMEAVKKSRRLTGMANDMGTALHVIGELSEDYGISQALANAGNYLPIWKSKARKLKATKKNSAKRKRGRKSSSGEDDSTAQIPFMQRARKWRKELNEIKKISKGDYIGVIAAGVACLMSFVMLLFPGASQLTLLGIVGMMSGVTRRNIPNMSMETPFYMICGLLLFVVMSDSFAGGSDAKKGSSKKAKNGRKKPSLRRPKAESKAGGAAAARDSEDKSKKKKKKTN